LPSGRQILILKILVMVEGIGLEMFTQIALGW
jgi:hypothetical protein